MNGKTAARPGTKGLGQIMGGTGAGKIGGAAAMHGRVGVNGKSRAITAAAAATPGRRNGKSKTVTAAVITGRVTMTGAQAAITMAVKR